jgi:hypothetical protein
MTPKVNSLPQVSDSLHNIKALLSEEKEKVNAAETSVNRRGESSQCTAHQNFLHMIKILKWIDKRENKP